MNNTQQKRCSTSEKQVFFMCMCMVIALNVSVKGASGSTNKRGIVEEYRVISEQLTKGITEPNEIEKLTKQLSITHIKGWVESLSSADLATRTSGINNLRSKVGLDFGYDPNELAGGDKKRAIALKHWTKYPRNLEVAISTKIPKLTERHTRRNEIHRAWAAMFLGESSPHPAFLPLLRRIVRDGKEAPYTRCKALTAVTQIPHEGMIEFLISQLDAGPTELSQRAWEQLRKLTNAPISLSPFKSSPSWHDVDWPAVRLQYHKWWLANKKTYFYNRNRVMVED